MDIPADIIDQAARAHWNQTATIKWDDPQMQEAWKLDQRQRAEAQLRVLLDAGVIKLNVQYGA